MSATMTELRIHGRGGQGAVVASKLLAAAMFHEGRSVQSFPAFGVERRGAPVTAFLRFSTGPILLRCEITHPDGVIVLDPTLVEAVNVAAGLKPGGLLLINSPADPSHYPDLAERFKLATVDASEVARRHQLGSKTQPIVNTSILGAFASFSGMVALESVLMTITEEMAGRAQANIEAAREAAAAVRRSGRPEVTHV
jgi:2-oxoacid:acceptor oxidoreductase gamma subunit (pyruvate/2-ketoisovalerate family)